MNTRRWLGALTAVGCSVALAHGVRGQDEFVFSAERDEERVVIKAPGEAPVLHYQREKPGAGEPAAAVDGGCYTHPLYTPSGDIVTDVGPKDHPHHRGVFCAWVSMEGEQKGDWWGWGALAPKEKRSIVNREARITEADDSLATLRVINSWRAEADTILGERVTITTRQAPGCNIVDYEFKFTAPTRKSVVIAQNPFGGFCYRARPRGRAVVSGPGGEMQNPDAVFNKPETNWGPSRWYDLTYHTDDGKASGVAVMDHPSNPPSTWHIVRGIHMLNPCIVADHPVEIKFGEPLYLRYRVVAHDGDATAVDLDALFEGFTAKPE